MDKYTDSEWASLIEKKASEVPPSTDTIYQFPEIGSAGFMKTIDHTLLKLEAVPGQFDDLCAEAKENAFATVCVRPEFVAKCIKDLQGTDVQVASVIGFHEGTYDTEYKLKQIKTSITAGAKELDIVLNYLELQEENYATLYHELHTLRQAVPPPTTTLKLILETSQLSRSQIIAACVLADAAGFDFVKTSTGFNGPGATEEHVRLMAACCEALESNGRKMKVKASGGIRTLKDAVVMLQAGASRLGTSGGVWIAKEARESGGKGGADGEAVAVERPGLATRLYTDY